MWLVLVGILMVYTSCFLLHICYKSQNKLGRRNSSNANPSSGTTLSATLRPDGTIVSSTSTLIPKSASGNVSKCCALVRKWFRGRNQSHHHHWSHWICRSNPPPSLNSTPNIPPPSCLYYDEITQRHSDLPQSALTAQREQQLRQIKLEINELSRRLGIGQIYRERQLSLGSGNGRIRREAATNYNYSPIPPREELGYPLSAPSDTFTSGPRETLVPIGRTTRRTRNTNTNNSHNRVTTPGPRCLIVGESGESRTATRRHRVIIMMEDRHLINDEEGSSSSDDSSSLDDTTLSNSNSAPFAPHSSTNSCSSSISLDGDSEATFSSEAATGLGLVQTFTLGNRSNCRRNEIFHQRQRRLRLIRMEIEDLTLQLSSLSEDAVANAGGCSISSSEGLVFDQDTDDEGIGVRNANTSPFHYPGELPSYEQSIIVDFDDTPPPTYDQCTNLNSLHTHDMENPVSEQNTRMSEFYPRSSVYQEKDLDKTPRFS